MITIYISMYSNDRINKDDRFAYQNGLVKWNRSET